jgi:hypothetical protein
MVLSDSKHWHEGCQPCKSCKKSVQGKEYIIEQGLACVDLTTTPFANNEGVVVNSVSNHEGVVVNSVSNHEGVVVNSVSNHEGVVVNSVSNHEGVVVKSVSNHVHLLASDPAVDTSLFANSDVVVDVLLESLGTRTPMLYKSM